MALLSFLDNTLRGTSCPEIADFLRIEPVTESHKMHSIYIYLCASVDYPIEDLMLSRWASAVPFDDEQSWPFLTTFPMIHSLIKFDGLPVENKCKLLQFFAKSNGIKGPFFIIQ